MESLFESTVYVGQKKMENLGSEVRELFGVTGNGEWNLRQRVGNSEFLHFTTSIALIYFIFKFLFDNFVLFLLNDFGFSQQSLYIKKKKKNSSIYFRVSIIVSLLKIW